MISIRQICMLATGLLSFMATCVVQADIGVVRLRETRGPFIVTIFTCSELLQGTANDVCVMVQRRDSNEPILDATVDLVFTAPQGGTVLQHSEPFCGYAGATLLYKIGSSETQQVVLRATHDQPSNKLLYAITVNWPISGRWHLEALVRRGSDSEKVACEIAVGFPTLRLNRLLPYLALPPLFVALFAANQCLRRKTG